MVPAEQKLTVMEPSPTPGTEASLTLDEIDAGMRVAQTVYAVAMTIGLKNVLEAFYPIFFSPTSPRSGTLSLCVIALAFVAVMLLAIRFFWASRNLYAYLLRSHTKPRKVVFRRFMMVHFPIALGHAVLFFFVCDAFIEMAKNAQPGHSSGTDLAVQFVAIYAALLVLNALWLFCITQSGDDGPGRTWAWSNLLHSGLAIIVLIGFGVFDLSIVALIVAACTIFLVNSVVDLWTSAEHYFRF